jgi:hypothetical protein
MPRLWCPCDVIPYDVIYASQDISCVTLRHWCMLIR